MIWLTWRQHRAEALALALAVAVIGVILLVLGLPMHNLFPLGAAHCAVPPLDQACRVGLTQLQRDYGYATPVLILLNLVPFAIGAFLGAPLLARELEAGTWQLAWTQAVPRMRWLAVKLAALGLLAVALTGALAALINWYRQPLNLLDRFSIDGFDVSGVVPMAYGLFAFALAMAAGVLLRRSLPAMAAALVVFVAVRATVAVWLRPHFRPPIRLVDVVHSGATGAASAAANPQNWVLGDGFSDAAGHPLDDLAVSMLDHQAREAGVDTIVYMNQLGMKRWVSYHPGDRFWTFQFMETGIFVGLAAILVVLVIWRVRRRAL